MSTPTVTVYYPRGYMVERKVEPGSTLTESKVMFSDGDDEVEELYALWRSGARTDTWEYIDRVLACAYRLLGDVKGFVWLQGHNHRVYDHAWTFIDEMVRFIHTGSTQLQPLTAPELIEDHPERNGALKTARKTQFNFKVGQRSAYALTLWLSHENGLQHLIESLYVLFGRARKERAVALPIRTLSERKLTNGWVKISNQ